MFDKNIPMTKDALLASIQAESDPNRLMQYVRSFYDVDVVRSAANRCYELMEGKK
jgi:regulatory protein YycH of two-component signal transduction system YycFG